MSEQRPWAQFYESEGMGWPTGGLPAWVARHAERMDALEAAEQRREAEERAVRAEDRLERWRLRRAQELAMDGIAWDGNDASLVEDPAMQAERVFRSQDISDRRDQYQLLRSVGLEHLLPGGPTADLLKIGDGRASGRSVPASAPAAGPSASSPEGPAPRTGPIAKIREVLHRGGPSASPCPCVSCTAVRAARYQENHRD